MKPKTPYSHLLVDPTQGFDSCGTGFVSNINGKKTREVVTAAIQAVCCLTHRGAIGADARTGDGAGILTQIPWKLYGRDPSSSLKAVLARFGGNAELAQGRLGVGMIFLPAAAAASQTGRRLVERVLAEIGLNVLAWRPVPVDPSPLGDKALESRPDIQQVIVERGKGQKTPEEFERTLFLARKRIERAAAREKLSLYMPSFSSRVVVYKGLMIATQLQSFYKDLADPDFESALAVFHQRFTTNTFPSWTLAQPFRYLGHNGEINTLKGNRNWMTAREPELTSAKIGPGLKDIYPIITPDLSDSASLDEALEVLIHSGRGILHAFMMLVPQAWENMPGLDPELKAFYEYHACLTEPWDGPAAVAFSDGRWVGAMLDRNGLRPARYLLTTDGLAVMASEVGVIDIAPERVAHQGQLGPGEMIAVDVEQGKLYTDEEVKHLVTAGKPYGKWVNARRIVARQAPVQDGQPACARDQAVGQDMPLDQLRRLQRAFGYTTEELDLLLSPMAGEKTEPVGSMEMTRPWPCCPQSRVRFRIISGSSLRR